ncbi:adenine nucleotide alpha hydrolase family protein [Niabella ginsengisoli]|uniref:Universal stress protein n=1 Tax=Niabella ginsengisoli TaxID=522298 RepID=A0ABS9SPA6_9BACT|nr:universal stress protein [Niabella ginsengisoli]MCH5600239.1 universal stress protein [Niabella ginsengisoli]
MVNILIPTDFSQASFRLAEQTVKTLDKEVNIILFHIYDMPNGISDLIRKDPPYAQMMNDSFRQNCKYLKYKYPDLIKKICFKYLTGNTQAVFNNFTEANEIDMIVCPDNYVFTKNHKTSINPVPFFKKVKYRC